MFLPLDGRYDTCEFADYYSQKSLPADLMKFEKFKDYRWSSLASLNTYKRKVFIEKP